MESWGNPNTTRRFMNSTPPQGTPWEFNFWDYITAWPKAFLYQNKSCKHSWYVHLDLLKLIRLHSWFS